MPIINKGPYSLSLVSKFETVNYMVIPVIADCISCIYLTTEPVFLFLFGTKSSKEHTLWKNGSALKAGF